MALYHGIIRFSDEVVIQVTYDEDTPELAAAVIDETTGDTVIEAVSESDENT